ncbi:hypothetical protein DE146DRAFT_179366 [Phaeosphaeria sp. MPI-PUGE-AT-0046c]|nr:hypothetical protein DE146DRAFT_179366 [Phaeosphaeria sp. MPI-PUGE-AT-0046c]
MPVKWTPELDSILLHAVFEESGISFSKALCNKIAERVKATGIDCTPKAVENRLYSWKKKNVSSTAPAPSPAKEASATPTPSKGAKAKTGRVRSGKNMGAKQITPESEELESLSVRGKKRARTEEDENEVLEKKVKVEDLGEEDEGIEHDI